MVFIVRVLRFLFSLYAGTFFIFSLFIIMPCYFFIFNFWNKVNAPHVAHKVSRFWGRLLLIFFFVRAKVKGKQLIDPAGTYIFISNHRSMLDILLFAIACKNTFRFLAKAELTKIPLFGYMIKNLYITVKRADKSDRSRSMDVMMKSMEEHISVFICPEGTRNRTEAPLLNFHDGAFRLAVKTQKPLAVLTVINSDKLLSPSRPVELAPGVIYAEWSTPIETKGMTENDLPKLKEKAKHLMLDILNKK